MPLRTRDGRALTLPQLLRLARGELGLTQHELGEKLGVSRRTMIRWGRGHTAPVPFQMEDLAALLRAVGGDELADSLLEAMGLPIPEPPAAPFAPIPTLAAPSPASPLAPFASPAQPLVDAVLFAAADAADLAPRKARLALRAALLRAKELGLAEGALAEALLAP